MKYPKLRKNSCKALMKAVSAYIEKVDTDLADALDEAGFLKSKATVKTITSLEDELEVILSARMKIIISRIDDYDSVADFLMSQWDDLQNAEEMVEDLKRTFENTYNSIIPEYASGYIERIDPQLTAMGLTHETTNWITTWSSQLADIMNLNNNSAIDEVLRQAVTDGLSVQDTMDKISGGGIRDPGYRARRVATTEVLRAHSVAQQESFMQSPSVTQKMWRHSGFRAYSRQNHIDMDGQTVGVNDLFTVYGADGGVYYAEYPRDSALPPGESINCGCIAQPIVDEAVLGLSLEERKRLQEEAIAELDADFDAKLDEQNQQLALRF